MKKISLRTSCAIIAMTLFTYSLPAQAQTSRIYFAGYLGINDYNDMDFTETTTASTGSLAFDNAPVFAGALGIRLTPQLRIEGEYAYSKGDLATINLAGSGSYTSGGNFESKIIFANLYYDFDVPWAIQPYLGGGLGYGWHSATINDGSALLSNAAGDAAGMMWNAGGGIKYRPRSDMAFTAGYRFVDSLGDLSFGSYGVDTGSHELRVGVEWDLPVTGR